MARKRFDRSTNANVAPGGSTGRSVKGRVKTSQDSGIDCSSVVRGVALLSVVLAITGFLVYPDVSRALGKIGLSGFSEDPREPARLIRKTQSNANILKHGPVDNSEQLFQHPEDNIDDKTFINYHDDDEDVTIEDGEGNDVSDLMEDEVIAKEKIGKERRKMEKLRSSHKANFKDGDKSSRDAQSKEAIEEKDTPIIPRRPGRDKNAPPPIVLGPGSGPVTLDPSQIRFVDTPLENLSHNTKKNTMASDSKKSRKSLDVKATNDKNSENKTAKLKSSEAQKPTNSKQTAKNKNSEQSKNLNSNQTSTSKLNGRQSSAQMSNKAPKSHDVSESSKKISGKPINVKEKNKIPPVQGRPGRDKNAPPPIVLKPGSGPISLDSSQIRFDGKPSKLHFSKDSVIENTSSIKTTSKKQAGSAKGTHKEPIKSQGSAKKNVSHKRTSNDESKDNSKHSSIQHKDNSPPKASTDQTVTKPVAKQTTKSPSSKTSASSNTQKGKSTKQKADNIDKDTEHKAKKFNARYQKSLEPKKVFIDGRRIPPTELLHQKQSNSSVKVYLFNDFLSAEECDGLIRTHDSHVQALHSRPLLCFDSIDTLRSHIRAVKKSIRVTANDFTTGTKCLNSTFSAKLQTWLNGNWSYSTAFYPGESRFSNTLAGRIEQAMGLSKDNGGKFQITSYPLGKAYKEHTDCVIGGADRRDRVASVLMYLNDAEDGGETSFPDLGIWVKPRKGRALLWNNMSPDGFCEPHSKHMAKVVKKGSKYILIRWYYYKSFYALGKRQPEPALPARDALQPLVMCDQYNMGSCRWYDEWTNDVLVQYQNNKIKLH